MVFPPEPLAGVRVGQGGVVREEEPGRVRPGAVQAEPFCLPFFCSQPSTPGLSPRSPALRGGPLLGMPAPEPGLLVFHRSPDVYLVSAAAHLGAQHNAAPRDSSPTACRSHTVVDSHMCTPRPRGPKAPPRARCGTPYPRVARRAPSHGGAPPRRASLNPRPRSELSAGHVDVVCAGAVRAAGG